MKQFYKNGDECYFIHRNILISHFADKEGILNMDNVKIWRDYLNGVDHVLRTDLGIQIIAFLVFVTLTIFDRSKKAD